MIVPWRRPEFYRTGQRNPPVAGIPIMSIAGVCAILSACSPGCCTSAIRPSTREESEKVIEQFHTMGMTRTAIGGIGNHIEWYYLDTEPGFKCIIESGSGHAFDFLKPGAVYPRTAEPLARTALGPTERRQHSHGAIRGVEEPAWVLLKQHAQLCIGEARSMQERIQVRLDMVVAPSAVLVETHLHADVVAD
jgi:hypothetical protein